MEYYNPNDNTTKQYAAIAVIVFMAVVAFAVSYISITVTPSTRPPVLIELVAEESLEEEKVEEPKKQPKPTPKQKSEKSTMPAEVPVESKTGSVATPDTPTEPDEDPLVHTNEAEETQSAATKGEDVVNQTINPNAMFPVNNNPSSDVVPSGNPKKPEGTEESDKGDGEGDNIAGEDSFDAGDPRNNPGFAHFDDKLRLRGYTYLHISGRHVSLSQEVYVNVLVKVEPNGKVSEAVVVSDKTTTTDEDIRSLAKECAEGTTFKPGQVETYGYILYHFEPK